MVFFVSLVPYFIYLFLKTTKNLQMLQQNRYNRGNKYLKWVKSNLKKNFLNWEFFGFLLLFFIRRPFFELLFFFYMLVLIALSFYEYKRSITKLPLKYTGRILRLLVTLFVLYLAPFLGLLIDETLCFILFVFMLYLNAFVVVLANSLNFPIEKMINYYFKMKSLKRLKSFKNLEVIGVTGSYGKTSSKNILNDVLSVKFNPLKTPKNYNTPFGLMITINDYLDKFHDYFIAEMGACKKNEIKELCDLVHPKYGILTKIGMAHLETFGSQETIIKTKFELIESLPKEGLGVLNADDENQVNYALKNTCSILWIGIDNKEKADIYADEIQLSSVGTTFTCHFKKEKETLVIQTRLLGRANIYNLLAAIALGKHLGLTKEQLELGVKKVKPIEHRLNMKKYYDMVLIDDAYNANIEGAKMALDVLNLSKGKKIVISSGIIELGALSYETNKELGKYMVSRVDVAILIGEKQTKPIYDGLIEKKFKKENIYVVQNIQEGLNLLNKLKEKETYILLQSDLPDIFNES